MPTSSFSSTQLFQDFPGNFQYSRKLLPLNPHDQQPVTASPPPPPPPPPPSPCPVKNNLDMNVVMFFSILVSAVICSLGFNFLIRCAFVGFSRVLNFDSNNNNNSVNPSVKTPIDKETALLQDFPVLDYTAELNLPGLDTECVICLSEFAPGERLRILPNCKHGFHVSCIDTWLRSHSSCPKCRHCVTENCETTIAGCDQEISSGLSGPAVAETVVSIRPLEPEGIICHYGGLS